MSPIRTIASPSMVKGLSSFKKQAQPLTPLANKRIIINDDPLRKKGVGSTVSTNSNGSPISEFVDDRSYGSTRLSLGPLRAQEDDDDDDDEEEKGEGKLKDKEIGTPKINMLKNNKLRMNEKR